MEHNKDSKYKRADKFVDDVNSGKKSDKKSPAHVEIKPEIVRDIPTKAGRHGVDPEKELNPEE